MHNAALDSSMSRRNPLHIPLSPELQVIAVDFAGGGVKKVVAKLVRELDCEPHSRLVHR